MLTVDAIEAIRRAYYCEHKSVRAIARDHWPQVLQTLGAAV